MRPFFDDMMALGVEGMMVSPGYPYAKAPDQEHFLHREQTKRLFRQMLSGARRSWRFNQTPLFLEFLQGHWELECTPWGSPTYNLFGWQRPCYLLDDGYCQSFRELMETTDWDGYGHRSGNARCADCMVHCGYEPSAVGAVFGSWKGLWATARLTLFGPSDRPADLPAERETKPMPAALAHRPVAPEPHGKRELPVVY
jgi:hopanoid biosynthesis associated radical SAM protein HpnH